MSSSRYVTLSPEQFEVLRKWAFTQKVHDQHESAGDCTECRTKQCEWATAQSSGMRHKRQQAMDLIDGLEKKCGAKP